MMSASYGRNLDNGKGVVSSAGVGHERARTEIFGRLISVTVDRQNWIRVPAQRSGEERAPRWLGAAQGTCRTLGDAPGAPRVSVVDRA